MENESEKKVVVPKEQSWGELVRFAILALLIVIPVRVLVAEPFVVSGSSMVPTFQNGDYLIVDKISYKLSEPDRDDVIVFVFPDQNKENAKKFLIKRIIGLPNETVDVRGGTVTVTSKENPEGVVLTEPYIHDQVTSDKHLELKSDEYFVMGDNRVASSDSRYWGAVPRKNITGRAFLRLLPISHIDMWPGDYKQNE